MTRIIDGKKYLMRDTRSTPDLWKLYWAFCRKFGDNLMFHEWLVQRGKVYLEIKEKAGR